jgi:CDP-diacylglycerol--glycerol-3-phosphate 3-phosphatidyltransferase
MSPQKSYLVPNLVIVVRVILAFVAVALLGVASPWAAVTAVVLTVVAIAMDGLDGYLARKLDLTSELGAVLDITADRIVEHIFWIAFAVFGQVELWVPLVIMTRSFLVDTARGMALARGKTAFGSSTMQRSAVSRFLTGSRFVRSLYGVAKVAAFVLLGTEVAVERALADGAEVMTAEGFSLLGGVAQVSVWVAVVLCVVRGVPVLLDGRMYLMGDPNAEGSAA